MTELHQNSAQAPEGDKEFLKGCLGALQTYLHAPAPAPPPGLEDLPAGAVGRPGVRDGTSIEGVGIGLETDYPSTIPTDGTSVTPTRNPYLDRNRQGAGSVSLTPGSQGP